MTETVAVKVDELKPCPFCGCGEFRFDETTHWTGQRYILLKVYLHHWCNGGNVEIKVKHKTKQLCTVAWNEMVDKAISAAGITVKGEEK